MMHEWIARYIGVPFKRHGRGPDGWDCWGLARWVEAHHYGVQLPGFDAGFSDELYRDPERLAELVNMYRPLVDAQPVSVPEDGDLAVLTYRGHPSHVGVYVGEGYLLHVLARTGTVLDRITSIRNQRRVEGFYRV